jgi:hypothetical protein
MEGTARSRYGELKPLREPFIRRARACSKFTLPSLIPPEGWDGNTDLPEPWNNLGARGVNNLSSKLLLALFPPGSACFRNELDPKTLLKLKEEVQDPKQLGAVLSQIDDAMADIEKRFVTETEASMDRVALGQAFKHLVVGGNILLHVDAPLRAFRLDKYVVLRDPSGMPLEMVVEECVARAALPEKVRALLEDTESASAASTTEEASPATRQAAAKTVELYTHVYWTGRVYKVYQEIVGKVVPGSRGSYPKDKCPWLPLRWTAIDGEDYGWGHVDSFLGDLSTLDLLSQALTEGSAAAARVVYAKKPGSVANTKAFIDARNGGVVTAEADAFVPIQLQKFYDFKTAHERVQEIERSLSFAFLLNTAIQRQGERVTAEEIRYMAQELEDALGGVYSVLSQELQLPYVRRRLHVMAQQRAIPPLPNDIKPVIITGLEALGRGNDWTRLLTWLSQMSQALGPELVAQYMNPDEIMRRGAVALSIDTKGLIKTPEEIAAAQQQAAMAQMIEKLGPQAVGAMGGIAKTHMDTQSKEQIASGKRDQEQQAA